MYAIRRTALIGAACIAAAWAGSATAADLVPVVSGLLNGTVAVRNTGDAATPPSHLTIDCEKTVGAGSCPEAAGMAAYEDPAFPNVATIDVPGLAPDETYSHDLSFWADLSWQVGTYELTVMVDTGNVVDEADETNNAEVVQKVQAAAAGVGGSDGVDSLATATAGTIVPGRGKLASAARRTVRPDAGLPVAAGLPDIIATPLGFIFAGAPRPWGSTVIVSQVSQAQDTGRGRRRDLCRFAQSGYRAANVTPFATGPFKSAVYRGGTKAHQESLSLDGNDHSGDIVFPLDLGEGLNVIRVRVDDTKQVAESNEANTFAIRVRVDIDCDGDGRVAGQRRVIGVAPSLARADATAPAAERRAVTPMRRAAAANHRLIRPADGRIQVVRKR